MSLNRDHVEITVITDKQGGQSCGTPDTRVKIEHVPTGLVAVCGHCRSQIKNRDIAIAMIEYGLAELGISDP